MSKSFFISNEPNAEIKGKLAAYNMTLDDLPPAVFTVMEDSEDFNPEYAEGSPMDHSTVLDAYVKDNFTEKQLKGLKVPKYFYEIEFEKPGGLVMPIIVEYTFADGTSERIKYPVQVWRKNDKVVRKVMASDKEITNILVDPDLETADIDTSNNSWPKKEAASDFENFIKKTEN